MKKMPVPPSVISNKNFNTNTKDNDEWLTPPHIVESLGEFDLDPCQPINPPFTHAKYGFNVNDDGLSKSWEDHERVWCNPPYGRETFKWLEKLYQHGNGIALIFARTETIGFHDVIWNKAHGVFFFKGRLKFYTVEGIEAGTANAPSCLIAYGKNNLKFIVDSNLKGKLVIL